MNSSTDQNPRRRGPNVFLIILLAVGLPVAGVFLLQVYQNRIAPLLKTRIEQADGDLAPSATAGGVTPAPSATPVPSPLDSSPTPPAAAEATPAQPPLVSGTLAPGEASNEPAKESEGRMVQREVLKRIDLTPDLTPAEQDKLYVQVERARHMACTARIAFAPGETLPSREQAGQLCEFLKEPDQAELLGDPTTVIVVLGYADKKGDDAVNLRISLERADNVRSALRDLCGVQNVMHSVGMGSSDLFSAENLDKNRLAEVWLVVP